MMGAQLKRSDLAECVLEVQSRIADKLQSWQQLRLDLGDGGINLFIEPKGRLPLISRLLGTAPRRVILSLLAGRAEPFCTMIDGVDSSRKWHSELSDAVARLEQLM